MRDERTHVELSGAPCQPPFPRDEVAVARPGRLCILSVDDNPFVRTVVFQTLGRHFQVISARSAREALPLLASQPVDLLLTDLMLPGMDGLSLAREARRTRPDLPVVFLSAYLDEDTRQRLRQVSPHMVAKPFDILELLETVRGVLHVPPAT